MLNKHKNMESKEVSDDNKSSITLLRDNCELNETVIAVKEEKIEMNESEDTHSQTNDVFSYTKRGDFTSEAYKIEVNNLPKHIHYNTFKKLMKKLDLKPLKIKLIGKPFSHSFVTFRSDEDREQAINKLNDFNWKDKILNAKKANPIPDPLIQKRNKRSTPDPSNEESKRMKLEFNDLSEEDLGNAINDQIMSFWKIPYNEQISKKNEMNKDFLLYLCREIGKLNSNTDNESPKLLSWYLKVKQEYDNCCCALEEVRVSPLINGYRNKCEFSVGIDKTVGFRLGLYRDGTVRVITPPKSCPIISDRMRKALITCQTYIKEKSVLNGFNPVTHEGHWRQATVRTTTNSCMLIMVMHPQNLSSDELESEKHEIIEYFKSNADNGVDSVYVHISTDRHELLTSNLHHLFGETSLKEIMLDGTLHFRISPLAFFQINSSAAEICYKAICELICVNPELTVLDICCGTGTIGITLASKVKKVISIELNEDAINDAKFNAQLNNITNIEFIQGRAEDVISKVLMDLGINTEIVAVIDPPRAGLNISVIKAIRSAISLKRLVYVSCDPLNAKKNLIDLCRPPSKSYKGEPFVPIRAVPIDMFPHTNRCELLLLYERLQ